MTPVGIASTISSGDDSNKPGITLAGRAMRSEGRSSDSIDGSAPPMPVVEWHAAQSWL